MDLDSVIDTWTDRAITTSHAKEGSQSKHHHYNITYALYDNILEKVSKQNLNVHHTMTSVLKMFYPEMVLPKKLEI